MAKCNQLTSVPFKGLISCSFLLKAHCYMLSCRFTDLADSKCIWAG